MRLTSKYSSLSVGALLLCWSLVCLCVAPNLCLGQVGDTGQIQGTVNDTSGAIIPGATVTATAVDTNRTLTAVTNKDGSYTFPTLPIGQYRIEVKMQGFKTVIRTGITLNVQQVAVVNITLEVGAVNQSIEVRAAAPLLNTQEASQGQVIDSRRITDIPLNGRDYVQLALLSEGTVQPANGSRFGGFSTNGQRTTENNYMVNGVDNNDMEIAAQGLQAEVVKPIVDAVEEFKVQTNAYSAEFGKAAGGVLNLRIKSGTNTFHGSAWEFIRNEAMDARDYFNSGTQSKAPFKRNQFGGTIGGPVVKNRLFFFEALEWERRRESASIVNTLPTVKMRSGDFSELSAQIYDPDTYNPATGTRQPFAGNIIPPDRIDSVASKVIALLPPPQTSGLSRNYTFTSPVGFNNFKDDARVDQNLGVKDNFAYTFDWQGRGQLEGDSYPGPLGVTLNHTPEFFHGTIISAQWNHIISPTLVTTTKVAWNRQFTNNTMPLTKNYNKEIGLTGVAQDIRGIAIFNTSGFTSFGADDYSPNLTQSQNRQLISDTNFIKGNHQIKFGANVQWLQNFLQNPQDALGNFTFNGNFTRNPLGPVGGNALADFMLGIPVNTLVTTGVYMNLRTRYQGFYVQDTWKVTSKLTLDYGLRYDLFLPWLDKKNGIANFDPSLSNAPVVNLIVAQSGSSREARSLIAAYTKAFAPRVGLAYDIGHDTVVRAGYGIFYGTLEPSGGGQFLETNLPFKFSASVTTDNIHPSVILEDGVPDVLTPDHVTAPVLSSFQSDFHFPYNQEWNFNIQHTFGTDWLVQVGYFGSAAHHLLERLDLNQPPPGPGNINARRPFKSTIFPGTSVVVSPLAGFNSHIFAGNNTYNSLQAKLEKRFSSGFTVISNFTYSRDISDTCGLDTPSGSAPGCVIQNVRNLRLMKGLDSQHQKVRFVASYVYVLPFGKGKHFGQSWSGAIDAVLGGWSTNGIFTLASGTPFTVDSNGDPTNVGTTNTVDFANIIGNPARPAGADKVNEFFNTAAFTNALPYTFGNLGKNTMIGPSLGNWDFGLFKQFMIAEKVRADFRFEAFNFTNTPYFGAPGNRVGTPTFGELTSSGPGRKLQLAVKFSF
jgi:outer membrane receptor protein involved in Fe transport